jgi:hypothetical protein
VKRTYLIVLSLTFSLLLGLIAILFFSKEFEFNTESDDDRYYTLFEASSADCFEEENYDSDEEACYLVCDTIRKCEDLEEELLAKYEDSFETFDDFEDEDFDFFENVFSADVDQEYIVRYDVRNGEIEYGEEGSAEVSDTLVTDEDIHEQIWELLYSILPRSEVDQRIESFYIFSDGVDETMAYVEPVDLESGELWNIGIDPLDSIDAEGNVGGNEIIHTIIHEFAHIVTLNDSQIEFSQTECSTYYTGEGCSYEDSYINMFFQNYWEEIYEELPMEDADSDSLDEYYESLDDFYERYEDRFVSDYAATNPGEDIAESYTEFILKDAPSGDSIADQKVLFFYEFDELVVDRNSIRRQIASL